MYAKFNVGSKTKVYDPLLESEEQASESSMKALVTIQQGQPITFALFDF